MAKLTRLPSWLVKFKQAFVGAIERLVFDKLADEVNAKDFGAVGDGITDDSAAIQLALNTGERVKLNKGRYVILTGLVIPAGGSLVGRGNRITTLLPANNIDAITASEVGCGCEKIGIEFNPSNKTGRSIVWKDGALSGVIKRIWTTNAYDSLSLGNCQGTLVEHFESWYFLYSGIRLTDNFNDSYFNYIFLNGAKYGTSQQGDTSVGIRADGKAHAMFFNNFEVIQCNEPLRLNGNSPTNVLTTAFSFFMNGFFDSSTSPAYINNARNLDFIGVWFSNRGDGCLVNNSRGVRFIGGQFVNNGRHGLIVNPNCIDVTVTETLFDSNGQDQYAGYYGLVASPVVGLSVTNNTFGNLGTFSATMQGMALTEGVYDGVLVSGNKFLSSLVGNKLSNGATGTDIIICDNIGYKTKSKGSILIGNTASTVVVTHGLSRTPALSDIQLTMLSGKAGTTDLYVSAVTATNFTISLDKPPTSTINIAWFIDSTQA